MTTAVRSPVTEYAHAVVGGAQIACKFVRQACERHLRDLEMAHLRGLHFDEDEAQASIDFFGLLKHSKGEWAGQPLILEPWQEFIIGSVFGWQRADGSRRFRVAYVEVPRKNGKSLLSAGVGLKLAFFDSEGGAEVYAAATKRDQAKIVFGDARAIVLAVPALKRRITVPKTERAIGSMFDESTRSKFEPLGQDADSLNGLNIHGAIVDELHAHKTRLMWDVLQTATGARRQPLTFAITTAGSGRESVCWQQHQYGTQILDSIFEDDTFFCFIATMDDEDDWTDPETWRKANPNYGVSVKVDDLERKCAKAQLVPAEQNAFQRLHLNVWTDQVTRWLSTEIWDEGSLPSGALTNRPCYAGVIASEDDLTAIVLWFPDEVGGGDALSMVFMPADNIAQVSRETNAPLDRWAADGWIEATEGNVTDYDFVRRRLNDLQNVYDIREVAVRQHNTLQLQTQLMGDGFTVVPINRGFPGMSAATKEVERLLTARKLRHGGHPVLRWMASNIAVRQDADGEKRPDREKSGGNIHGMEALIVAVARAMVQPEDSEVGVFFL